MVRTRAVLVPGGAEAACGRAGVGCTGLAQDGDDRAGAATVAQQNRRVPVSFPVSADWWGSALLYIGPAKQAPFWSVAAYDPATGQLTGIRPGSVQLGVIVNSVTKSTSIKITR